MFKKIFVVATATIMVVAAQATFACDTAKGASATGSASCTAAHDGADKASCCAGKDKQASSAASSCAEKKAAFESSGSKYLCEGSRAKFAQMAPFGFMKDADPKVVNVSVETTDNGFALVFTGVTQENVDQAVFLANQSMDALGKPAACAITRAGMIESAGDSEATKACLSALADCSVDLVEIEGGAKTVVSSQKPEKIKELHGVLSEMGVVMQQVSADSE